jgi:hypothetical protein
MAAPMYGINILEIDTDTTTCTLVCIAWIELNKAKKMYTLVIYVLLMIESAISNIQT